MRPFGLGLDRQLRNDLHPSSQGSFAFGLHGFNSTHRDVVVAVGPARSDGDQHRIGNILCSSPGGSLMLMSAIGDIYFIADSAM